MMVKATKCLLVVLMLMGLSGCKIETQDGECYGFCPPWFPASQG